MSPLGYLETGIIECADNLETLARLPDHCIDLVYLDPPFFSNRNYQVIWGDESEVRSFEDQWEGGMNVYVAWMRDRAREMHRVLKPTGSLYFHCDWHASHYLKVMLDGLFGLPQFRNEIIWKRTTAHSSAKRFAPIHDTILYYAKGRQPTWNSPREEYDQAYLDKYYKFDDGDGHLYWRADLCASGVRNGESGLPWRGIDPSDKGMHWKFTVGRLDELDAEGRIYWPPRGKMPQYKRYRDDLKGKAVADLWLDVDRINPVGSERVGYPTQKPEALLERIVLASSNPGDIVLDPFCGCGTTLVVAERLKRQWIGIDISPTAAKVMKRRLEVIGATVDVRGLPVTADDLKQLKPFEFQNWIIQSVLGTHSPRKSGDMGIDGFSFFERYPIQVKQSERVGRNVVDNFETAVRREGSPKGYIIAFSFGRGAVEEAARTRLDAGPEIVLVTVSDVLRVGGLIESAEADRREPDLRRETPDLLELFRAEQRSTARSLFSAPPDRAGRPAREIFESLRKSSPKQLDIGS